MRLLRLELQRYGHLSQVELDFPPDATLVVVHGENEAGKSTALAAIADALFGIPERTRHAFLHPPGQLRLRMTLQSSSGAVARFVRRKGRGNTLLDAEGAPLPEGALAPFLGGVDRRTFETTFGLDGERLRAGGAALAELGGGAGESLFAAETGTLRWREALEQLDEEAKALHGDGRGRRRIAQAVEAWKAAVREVAERAVLPRDWQAAEAALAATTARLDALREQAREREIEASRLERVRRVRPVLARLEAAEAEAESLRDAPSLRPDAARLLRERVETAAAAARDRARELAEAERLSAELDATRRFPALLERQDAIDALAPRLAVVEQALGDLPEQRLAVAGRRAAVAEAASGLSRTAEAARAELPPHAARKAAQKALRDHARLEAARAAAERKLEAARTAAARAEAALSAQPEPPDPAPLRRAIEAARAAGPLDEAWQRAEARWEAARASTARALAALPGWAGGAEALEACAAPLPAERAASAARLREAEERARQAAEAVGSIQAELEAAGEKAAGLERGETVPTREAVQAARMAREVVWGEVRAAVAGTAPGDPAMLAARFEAARDAADRLADRRAEEAQRVADWLALQGRQAALRTRHAQAVERAAAAEAARRDAESAWQGLWRPAGIEPVSPEAMAEWLRQREQVLACAAAAREAAQARQETGARREAARALLRKFLGDAEADTGLAGMLHAAETACLRQEAAAARQAAAAAELTRERDAIVALEAERTAAAAALAQWEAAWRPVTLAARLDPGAEAAQAEAALEAWDRIAEHVPSWTEAEQRVAAMDAVCRAFARDVLALAVAVGDAAAEEAAPVAARRLERALASAREAERTAQALAARIAEHRKAAETAEARQAEAAARLAALRAEAGVADDAALAVAIERAERRERARAAAAAARAELAMAGDGLAAELLREEAAAAGDPDALVARLAANAAERQAIAQEREARSEERTREADALARLRDGRDAAAAAQEARHALAEASAAAERYAQLHTARVLLRSGIERWRRTQQDPLLAAAGGHLATLTGGRYTRLIVEREGDAATLVALRDTGTECRLEALSEGTRDQLYLALRVAIVAAHAARAEPLPFVADDLLVHFDDARAAAALRLLATLGETAPAILFTHHEHVVALAEAAGDPRIAIRRLGMAAETARPDVALAS